MELCVKCYYLFFVTLIVVFMSSKAETSGCKFETPKEDKDMMNLIKPLLYHRFYFFIIYIQNKTMICLFQTKPFDVKGK